MFARTLLLAAAAFVSAPAGGKPAEPKTDREALIGTWKVTAYQDDGRDALARLGAGPAAKKGQPDRVAKVVFTPDECYVLTGAGTRSAVAGHTQCDFKGYTLGEAARPRTIDLVSPVAGAGGEPHTYRGIYELDGRKLTICYNESHKATTPESRPTKFESTREMNLFVCEKVSDTPEKPRE